MRTNLEASRLLFWFVVIASLLWIRTASAQTSLTIAIDCPDLSEDERAALEVRARADLDVRGVVTGTRPQRG
jgi:hypothetical protein